MTGQWTGHVSGENGAPAWQLSGPVNTGKGFYVKGNYGFIF